MANFTEGEWKYTPIAYGLSDDINYEIESDNGDGICGEWGIYSESDARLMAQSKKMYEMLKEIDDAHFELVQLPDSMREKVEAILSEIDKE